jgi:Flp pilus assembly protein TadG
VQTRFAGRAPSRTRGVAAVEFGLLLIPLVLMAFGTTELGRAIYTYNTLDKTVRDAARHLSQHGPGDSAVANEARCLAVYGKYPCNPSTDPAVADGLTMSDIVICDAVDATGCPGQPHANVLTGLGSINLVTVRVQGYAYNSLVEFVVPDMTFNTISTTMRAQL